MTAATLIRKTFHWDCFKVQRSSPLSSWQKGRVSHQAYIELLKLQRPPGVTHFFQQGYTHSSKVTPPNCGTPPWTYRGCFHSNHHTRYQACSNQLWMITLKQAFSWAGLVAMSSWLWKVWIQPPESIPRRRWTSSLCRKKNAWVEDIHLRFSSLQLAVGIL